MGKFRVTGRDEWDYIFTWYVSANDLTADGVDKQKFLQEIWDGHYTSYGALEKSKALKITWRMTPNYDNEFELTCTIRYPMTPEEIQEQKIIDKKNRELAQKRNQKKAEKKKAEAIAFWAKEIKQLPKVFDKYPEVKTMLTEFMEEQNKPV